MTTSTQLMARVRSNIYETTGATGELSRTDAEIYAWLDESQYDYVAKLPKDAFPELIVEAAAASWPWTIPTGFSELIEAIVTHTVGAAPFAEVAYLLGHGESYLRLNQGATTLGAWVQIRGATIDAGPSPLSGVIKYFRIPAPINIAGLTLELGTEHEGPIIDRATAHALQKINDEDAAFYLASYEKRVAAEIGKSNGGK